MMGAGVLFALMAGLLWALAIVSPLLLPDYPGAMQAVGRHMAYGLVTLPLAWLDRGRLARLSRADWVEALKLALVGNLLYYFFLSSAVGHAGSPLPTMLIGTLPVVIAITANIRNGQRDGRLPWAQMLLPLGLMAAGIACVNQAELAGLHQQGDAAGMSRYAWGAVLGLGAVVCWTWYPLRNADWLRNHPGRSPRTWATAQGVATLPLALLGYGLVVLYTWLDSAQGGGTMPWMELPLGPRPFFFVGVMLALGMLSSWLGALCWNEASQRLPTRIVGQLIVFETLAALLYAYLLRGQWPQLLVLAGIVLLVLGVVVGVRIRVPDPS